ncbi:MAG: hypothetical protein JEZ07_04210 [Phycisphaerae bacterium]|nr:hypothetical protein [Phycisphaerae bacterium]
MEVKIVKPKSHLTLDKIYIVVGISQSDLRIVDDDGEPILYPISLFEIVDKAIPSDWEVVMGDEGETYWNPDFVKPGFYEDWHDGDLEVRYVFAEYYQKLLNERA